MNNGILQKYVSTLSKYIDFRTCKYVNYVKLKASDKKSFKMTNFAVGNSLEQNEVIEKTRRKKMKKDDIYVKYQQRTL